MFLFISFLLVSVVLCFPPHLNPSLKSLMPPQIVPCSTSLPVATWSRRLCRSIRHKSCELTPSQRHRQQPQESETAIESTTFFTSSLSRPNRKIKVVGGDLLLKLIALDWFTVNKSVDRIALHPRCLVQVTISFAKILLQVTRPLTAILRKILRTIVYRNIQQYPEATKVPWSSTCYLMSKD